MPMIMSYHACLSVPTLCFRSVEIETTVTRDAAVADAWVRGLRASHPHGAPFTVGLDCKWNKQPTRSPAWMAPKAAVLQLCAATGCLVLQLLYLRHVPEILREFLRDPQVQLVGVGVVEAADHGLVCAAPVELAGPCDAYLGLVGRDKLGLKEYAKKVLDLNMEKPESVGMSDWEKHDLSLCQIGYACVDSYVSYRLGEKVLLGR
ncbi:3'-5' exonuclease-like [Miscanthus floridulus]|uniref:3'-5' exonuclease-like n=1 Tax=Miscanthus floridulus TaxID=154761 RepID=UPI00345A1BB3